MQIWEQIWRDAIRNLGAVYIGLAIVFVVTTVIRKGLSAQRKLRVAYVLSDGGLNSVTATLDVKLSEVERRRILSEYAKVLATYAPVYNPNSALDVRPTP